MELPDGLQIEVSNDSFSFKDSLYTSKLANKQKRMFGLRKRKKKPFA